MSAKQQTSNHSAAVISVYVLKAMMIVTTRMRRRESKSAKDNFELIKLKTTIMDRLAKIDEH